MIRSATSPPPTLPTPGRRMLHLGIALAGWALFLYWWWLVLHDVTPDQMRFTGILIAATLALSMLLTIAWVFHNLRIFKARTNRTHVRPVVEDFSRDRRGREVKIEGSAAALKSAPGIRIEIVGSEKTYLPASQIRGRGPNGTVRVVRSHVAR